MSNIVIGELMKTFAELARRADELHVEAMSSEADGEWIEKKALELIEYANYQHELIGEDLFVNVAWMDREQNRAVRLIMQCKFEEME